jgi:aspartyl-tRNA synthetase
MTFIDLRDRYGITQLAFNMETNASLCEQARKLGREYVIQVKGEVVERFSKNKALSTGEIEIQVSEIHILNASKTPPFTIEDLSDGGDDLRMQYRYLDLRRNPNQRNIIFRHQLAIEIRNYLNNINFLEIETPFLIRSTPEGARDFVVPSRMNEGQVLCLAAITAKFQTIINDSRHGPLFPNRSLLPR